ncbi:alpha/beta hydrolase fold domain-containing protein [Clostridium tertium]|uniref:Acetyl esterase n=1 Tax=Clostridium tertium TaxID=1559 RepID=A0A6N3DLI3_9CLOT
MDKIIRDNKYFSDLKFISKNKNIEVINGLEVEIKDFPNKLKESELYPRVFIERNKPKNIISLKDGYTYKGIPVEEMRLSMGYKNLDISNGIESIDKVINTGKYTVPIKIYRPKSDKSKMKCMVFIHGGGFYGGDINVVENPCKAIADKGNITVISIDYSLSPENKYPIAINECFEVLKYIYDNSSEFNINKDKIFISGDSAGGNLALVCAIRDSIENLNIVKQVSLLYPLVSLDDFPWSIENYNIRKEDIYSKRAAESLGKVMDIVRKLYLNAEEEQENYEVSPLLFNENYNIENILVISAEFDYLRLQIEDFVKKIGKEKNNVRYILYKGMDHAFLDKLGVYPQAEDCIDEIVKEINKL